MTQLDDLKAYLSITLADQEYTDAVLSNALAAETAAQANTLKAGVVVTSHPDLVQALYRRVSRNLAMRALPLSINTDEAAGSTYIGARDPEIRRLEAPYRKRVVG